MGQADPAGHEAIENAGLHFEGKKPEVVGVKGGMEAALNRGKIDCIVLHSWVVSFHEQRPGAYQ